VSAEGLSKARLARMHQVMATHVESGRMPGVVTLISRRRETHIDAIGAMAFGGPPMRRDTIFRIASMSKPVTAAAAMILVEESKLRLDDPVDHWLPELKNRRVLRSIDSPLDDTVPAKRAIILRDLLTFRLGYGAIMEFPPKSSIAKAMTDAGVAPGPNVPSLSPNEFMRRFSNLPLVHQPGERWLYHRFRHPRRDDRARRRQTAQRFFGGTDFRATRHEGHCLPCTRGKNRPARDLLLGRSQIRRARGFRQGTWWEICQSARAGSRRCRTCFDRRRLSRLRSNDAEQGPARARPHPIATLGRADDYGHVTAEQKAVSPFFPGFWESRGWGFGLSVVTRRDDLARGPGCFGWDGGYGTSAYVDPEEDMVGILMTQRLWDSPRAPAVIVDFWTQAYSAIDD
jgi:CubicO group peptidase (beta-lactamase class C family)